MPTIACRVIGPCWLFKWSHKHETFKIVRKSWNPKKLLVQKRSRDFFYHFEFCDSFPRSFLYTFYCYFLTFKVYCNLGRLTELTYLFPLKTNKMRLTHHFRLFLADLAFLWFFIPKGLFHTSAVYPILLFLSMRNEEWLIITGLVIFCNYSQQIVKEILKSGC